MPVLLLLLLAAAVVSCFHLSPEARVLRDSVNQASGVTWRQRLTLHAGYFTLGAIRAGLSRVRLDPAARAALQSVDAAGVGIYQLPAGAAPPDRAVVLAAADLAMAGRRWERVVGVIDGSDLVAVYVPHRLSGHRLKCCVLVLDGKKMVLVSARGNPEPLLDCALAHAGAGDRARIWAQR